MSISESLLNNVDERALLNYLSKNNCAYTEKSDIPIKDWITNQINEQALNVDKFNEFLLEEIFYGMHRTINIYKIKGILKFQNIDIWNTRLFETFNISHLPFNSIANTRVNREINEKIAAVDYLENECGQLEYLKILFVAHTKIILPTGISDTYSYIPVEIDFKKRIMIIKARPRNKILNGYKPRELQEKIFNEIIVKMGIKIKSFINNEHEKALYRLSKEILENLLANIPGYKDIPKMNASIMNFIDNIPNQISLQNITKSEQLKTSPNKIMDIEYELKNMLQNLTLADYFFNKNEDNIWSTGINTIIMCIQFNDSKNATARLSSENRNKHIFNSKAFMDLRNSLESVKNVQALKIAYKKTRGTMQVKYETVTDECLKILVLSRRKYNKDDFNIMWEMYSKNEKNYNTESTELRTEQIG